MTDPLPSSDQPSDAELVAHLHEIAEDYDGLAATAQKWADQAPQYREIYERRRDDELRAASALRLAASRLSVPREGELTGTMLRDILDDTGNSGTMEAMGDPSPMSAVRCSYVFNFDAAAEAINARLSVPTWLPIETAPKDGTRLLLAKIVGHPGNYPDEPTKVIWWAVLGHWSAKFNNWNDGIEPAGLVPPTHWMPIPLPKSPA